LHRQPPLQPHLRPAWRLSPRPQCPRRAATVRLAVARAARVFTSAPSQAAHGACAA
jgi:hypothetical protein